ncbi:MAG: hypothetical protein AAGI69_21165 [Cyanobacteria bacterium P01_H01_bin.21]
MKPDNQSKEQELKEWEAALKDREIKVRMRELESEIDAAAPAKPKVNHKEAAGVAGLPKFVQFALIVVGVIIVARLLSWLAGVLLLAAAGWVLYKLFFERDRN